MTGPQVRRICHVSFLIQRLCIPPSPRSNKVRSNDHARAQLVKGLVWMANRECLVQDRISRQHASTEKERFDIASGGCFKSRTWHESDRPATESSCISTDEDLGALQLTPVGWHLADAQGGHHEAGVPEEGEGGLHRDERRQLGRVVEQVERACSKPAGQRRRLRTGHTLPNFCCRATNTTNTGFCGHRFRLRSWPEDDLSGKVARDRSASEAETSPATMPRLNLRTEFRRAT